MTTGFLKFFKAEQFDDTRPYPVEDGRLYREGVTTLIKHKSKEKTTCGKPKNIATTMALFFQNATRCVRIFDPRPLDEVYNDKDMLVEANIFLRRGGRIQFLHAKAENKFIALLNNGRGAFPLRKLGVKPRPVFLCCHFTKKPYT